MEKEYYMQDLMLQKYDRFFSFGCSFTQYHWPTWADVIGMHFDYDNFYNYGRCGAGNYFIAHSVLEADLIHKFTEKDLLMIMFTGCVRRDQLVQKNESMHWQTPGNVYYNAWYDKQFLKKYWSDAHGFLRDITIIKLLINYLQNHNYSFHLMSMVPLADLLEHPEHPLPDQLKSYNSSELDIVKSDIRTTIFNGDWSTRQPRATYPTPWEKQFVDNHAHPNEHLEYLETLWPHTDFSYKIRQKINDYHLLALQATENLYANPLIKIGVNYQNVKRYI